MKKAHLNGTVVCSICGGEVSAGSWNSAKDRNKNRYMTIHLQRCETASEEDRAVFRKTGKWPQKRLNKRS